MSRCLRCRRVLKDPAAVALGYGKACAAKAGVPWPVATPRERLRRKLSKTPSGDAGERQLFPDDDARLIDPTEETP